jgi:hypothetical protein
MFREFGVVFYPSPTLPLPLKRREITTFLPFQGGGQEGDGASIGAMRDDIEIYEKSH